MKSSSSSNPLEHTANIKSEFSALVEHLRRDITLFDDARAKALFEVSAEVISGLNKAFEDYEKKTEPAWRNQS